MAKVYGYKKFSWPTTERVSLAAQITNDATTPVALTLGRKDVGAVIEYTVSTKKAKVLSSKPTSLSSGAKYYLLAEIPVMADSTDYHFVGAILRDMADIDNLIERNPGQDWAKQFYDLRSGGVK